jgi:DUF971 family protein
MRSEAVGMRDSSAMMGSDVCNNQSVDAPIDIQVDRAVGVLLKWGNGDSSFYPIVFLRKMSPSADMRQLREEMARNPLTVLPSGLATRQGPLTATEVELAGNYALKIEFSDGHNTAIYSWAYLREIDPHLEPPAHFATSM